METHPLTGEAGEGEARGYYQQYRREELGRWVPWNIISSDEHPGREGAYVVPDEWVPGFVRGGRQFDPRVRIPTSRSVVPFHHDTLSPVDRSLTPGFLQRDPPLLEGVRVVVPL